MRTMLLAAAALTLGIGSAYASDSEGASHQAITQFAGTPAPNAPSVAATHSGQTVRTFVTSSHGGYQFPAGAHYEGGNN
jgi:hypothetical protein